MEQKIEVMNARVDSVKNFIQRNREAIIAAVISAIGTAVVISMSEKSNRSEPDAYLSRDGSFIYVYDSNGKTYSYRATSRRLLRNEYFIPRG